jgi:hypothetical protein
VASGHVPFLRHVQRGNRAICGRTPTTMSVFGHPARCIYRPACGARVAASRIAAVAVEELMLLRNAVLLACLLASYMALSASLADAQPGAAPPPPPGTYAPAGPPPRVGLEIGAGLQAGRIVCESEGDFCNDFTEAGGVNLNAAYFLSPTVGITLDLWVMAHTEDDFTFAHYINTIGVKWRPVPILTLTAGIGSAHASLDYHGFVDARYTSEDAFAVMGAASLDVIRSRRWALSVEARFGTGFYGDEDENGEADIVGRNIGIGAGFTLFGF